MSEYVAQGWRMAGYYPGQYAKSMSALGIGIDYSDDDHDRYEAEFMGDLAAHDAKVKADAWDEGWDCGNDFALLSPTTSETLRGNNPYRNQRAINGEPHPTDSETGTTTGGWQGKTTPAATTASSVTVNLAI